LEILAPSVAISLSSIRTNTSHEPEHQRRVSDRFENRDDSWWSTGLIDAMSVLRSAFAAKADEFKDIEYGADHLQDARTHDTGQEFRPTAVMSGEDRTPA